MESRIFSSFLILAFITSCGTAAGGGQNSQCSKQCNAKKKLGCVGEESVDLADCKSDCIKTTKGSTSKSLIAVTTCMNDAVSCGQADSCYSKLEAAPVVDNAPGSDGATGGGSGGESSTGGGTGSTTGSTPVTPPSGAAGKFLNAYCDKFAECLGEQAGGVENAKQMCMTQAALSLEMVKPIADTGSSALQCVNALECEDVDSSTLGNCAGLDTDGSTCANGTTMKVCNLKGQCTNVDCGKICTAFANGGEGVCEPGEDTAQCACE